MKKINLCLVSIFMMLPLMTSCDNIITDDYITIYNAEDYINLGIDDNGYYKEDETSVLEDFKTWYKKTYNRTITVNYATFSTNEDIYNQIKLGSLKADLVCPSDYMIQKMASENMLEEFEYDEETDSYPIIENYNNYGSKYIKNLFKKNNLSRYSIPYTWGTMGFTYNMNYLDSEDLSSWDCMWDSLLKGKLTVKDSVRDTYFTSVMYVYKDELDGLANQYENEEITAEEYNNKLSEIFNRADDQTLAKCKEALIQLKKNIYGLEVDDGKTEIVKGTYYASLAWSGDAVYSMDVAEEGDDPTELGYVIPKEGSNIWFDGFCMPKGANIEIASRFMDFMSLPSTAAKNMSYTGYTSAIAGQEIWNLVNDWYAASEDDEDYSSYDEVDLSYFFEGTLDEDEEAKIVVSERGRQFDAQYPSYDVITRCAIMKDFGSQTEKLNQMWADFKAA